MAKIVIQPMGGKPRSIEKVAYDLEEILQKNIADLPDLIPLEEAIGKPTKLMTIGTEIGVGSGAIDILLIGSDSVLTIVETKLARNPESRREVIGQVLEYGALLSEWSLEDIRQAVNEHLDQSLEQALRDFLDISDESPDAVDDYLRDLLANLKDGKIRLIVAVDRLVEPALKTITFVNRNSNFELYLLLVTCHQDDDGTRIYIPSLHGFAPRTQPPPRKKLWDWDLFQSDLGWVDEEVEQAKVLNDRLFRLAEEWNPEFRFKGGWTNFYFGGRKSPCGVTKWAKHGVGLWFRLATDPMFEVPSRVRVRKTKGYLYLLGGLTEASDDLIKQYLVLALDQIKAEESD